MENKNELIGKEMLSESKFYMGYSRWVDVDNRYETWDESVERVMNMHRTKYEVLHCM
jgi:ribonucleoside-triphosphate reductase